MLCALDGLGAQSYGAREVQRGGKVSFDPRGSGVLFGALDPTVQRWYVPQELLVEYQWNQREYSNYARDRYQRYVSTVREGDHFYDFFGDYISRGWLVYDWRQSQPTAGGSAVFKSDQFTQWFGNVTVSSDRKGDNAYAITVGNQIRTTLTPMTFSKPAFNGIQADLVSDRYALTVLASRISSPLGQAVPRPRRTTNSTSLVGARAEVDVSDLITLGGTFVDARNSYTSLDLFSGNFLAGNLTAGQSSAPVTAIAVVLSDDSPDDGVGGAALFSHDVRITTRDFETDTEQVWTSEQVVRPGTEWPAVFGGFVRPGFIAADGDERIVLNYDFTDPAFQLVREDGTELDATNIIAVEFDYVLANDFKVEVWSNRQTGQSRLPSPPLTGDLIDAEKPALLTVRRAADNVKNMTNIQRVKFEYGLPTATMVAGFTIEGTDIWGVDFYGEWDRSFRYFQYPNATLFDAKESHEISRREADARYLTLSKQQFPFFAYGEAYRIDEDYGTSAFIVDGGGNTKYDQPALRVFQFVDDNDDQDAVADWVRPGSGVLDQNVFPGWDENNDGISDFNQNDNGLVSNELPDYEEPFLRYDVDRPEFLFGIDFNNNGWIDRFEDDELPDYPYKADREGYNAFIGMHLTPETRLMVGRADERMQSDDRENTITYGLFTFDKTYGGRGRVRVFDMVRRASDSIPDDRRQPSPFIRAPAQPIVEDFLRAQDTWINTAWLGLSYTAIERLTVESTLKYEYFNQRQDEPRDLKGRKMAGAPSLFGLINKLEYKISLGSLTLRPRLKSEYLRQDAFVKEEGEQRQWTGVAMLLARLPVLTESSLTAGIELAQFADRAKDEDQLVETGRVGPTGDERSVNIAVQVANRSSYLGYRLTTHIGLRLGRVSVEQIQALEGVPGQVEKVSEGRTQTTSFITVFAGVN